MNQDLVLPCFSGDPSLLHSLLGEAVQNSGDLLKAVSSFLTAKTSHGFSL